MKPRIAIISDLWGFNNDPYVNIYIEKLYNHFDVDLIDAQILGDIRASQQEQEIHSQFVESGIQLATDRLAKANIHFDLLIGLSVGGTIGWKAIANGANIDSLITISATRIRKEDKPLTQPVEIYFGELEEHGPSEEWFNSMGLIPNIIQNKGHHIYKDESFISEICEHLIKSYSDKKDCCS